MVKINNKKHITRDGIIKNNPIRQPKYYVGQKVHQNTVSWDDRTLKIKVNGTIIQIPGAIEAEGSNGKTIYYHIQPTRESVDALWGVDQHEFEEQYKNPTGTFIPQNNIKPGWVDEPGYQ